MERKSGLDFSPSQKDDLVNKIERNLWSHWVQLHQLFSHGLITHQCCSLTRRVCWILSICIGRRYSLSSTRWILSIWINGRDSSRSANSWIHCWLLESSGWDNRFRAKTVIWISAIRTDLSHRATCKSWVLSVCIFRCCRAWWLCWTTVCGALIDRQRNVRTKSLPSTITAEPLYWSW